MLTDQQLRLQTELDFLRAVLQDHDRLALAAGVNSDYIVHPIARPCWMVIAAHPDQRPTASWLYERLRSFPDGQAALALLPDPSEPAECLRDLLWGETLGEAGDIVAHADHVIEFQKRDRLDRIRSTRLPFTSAEEEARAMINDLQRLITDGGDDFQQRDAFATAIKETLAEWWWKEAHKGQKLGWKMNDAGLDHLHALSDGLKGERLNVTMALTSHGKSVWLLKQALAYAQTESDEFKRTPKVCYVSVEMNQKQIIRRLVAQTAMINMNDETTRPDAGAKIKAAADHIGALNANGSLTVSEMSNIDRIVRYARGLKMADKLDILVVDYIGGLSGGPGGDKASSYNYIGGIAESLRSLAHELDIPIITAHQLNRAAYSTGKPTLENTADSSKVSHVANIIQMFWRPDLTNKNIMGERAGLWKDVIIVSCEKNRSGPRRDLYYEIQADLSLMTPVSPEKVKRLQSQEERDRLYQPREGKS